MGIVVRKGLILKVGGHTSPAGRRIHGFQARRKRLASRISAELKDLLPFQKEFYGSSEPRPKLYLSGDRTFHNLSCNPGVQYERVGELDGLAHIFQGSIMLPCSFHIVG